MRRVTKHIHLLLPLCQIVFKHLSDLIEIVIINHFTKNCKLITHSSSNVTDCNYLYFAIKLCYGIACNPQHCVCMCVRACVCSVACRNTRHAPEGDSELH